MNALIASEIDYWEQVTPDLAQVVQQTPGVKVEHLDAVGNMGWGRFNHVLNDAKTLLQQANYKGEEFAILQPTDHSILNPLTLVTAEGLRMAVAAVALTGRSAAAGGSAVQAASRPALACDITFLSGS